MLIPPEAKWGSDSAVLWPGLQGDPGQFLDRCRVAQHDAGLAAVLFIQIPTVRQPVKTARHAVGTVADQNLLMRIADSDNFELASRRGRPGSFNRFVHRVDDALCAGAVACHVRVIGALRHAVADAHLPPLHRLGNQGAQRIVAGTAVEPGSNDDQLLSGCGERVFECAPVLFSTEKRSLLLFELCTLRVALQAPGRLKGGVSLTKKRFLPHNIGNGCPIAVGGKCYEERVHSDPYTGRHPGTAFRDPRPFGRYAAGASRGNATPGRRL